MKRLVLYRMGFQVFKIHDFQADCSHASNFTIGAIPARMPPASARHTGTSIHRALSLGNCMGYRVLRSLPIFLLNARNLSHQGAHHMPAMITCPFHRFHSCTSRYCFPSSREPVEYRVLEGAGWFDRCDHNHKEELQNSIFGGGGIYVHRNCGRARIFLHSSRIPWVDEVPILVARSSAFSGGWADLSRHRPPYLGSPGTGIYHG